MRPLHLLIATVAAALGAVAAASYLDGEDADPFRDHGPRPEPRIRRPVPDNALTHYVRAAQVGTPHTYRGLTVFPVTLDEPTDPVDYVSLREGLASGTLRIHEYDEPAVAVVWASNRGKRPVLILGGEVIAGGWQNRVLQQDVLLPARRGKVALPVYCVEQGRWSNPDQEFAETPAVAGHALRASAAARRGQAEVWNGVRGYQEALDAESPTQDLSAVQRTPQLKAAVEGRLVPTYRITSNYLRFMPIELKTAVEMTTVIHSG